MSTTWSLVLNSELNFVAIFNILTPQGPSAECLAHWPVPAEPMTASWNLRQTFDIFFYTDGNKGSDCRQGGGSVCWPGCYWAHSVIMAWLCSHGSGSGSHRMKAAGELFSGN